MLPRLMTIMKEKKYHMISSKNPMAHMMTYTRNRRASIPLSYVEREEVPHDFIQESHEEEESYHNDMQTNHYNEREEVSHDFK